MKSKLKALCALAVLLLASVALMSVGAYAGSQGPNIDHVLLISIDGFHALDYLNCSNGISTINDGKPYCPNLAALGNTGVNLCRLRPRPRLIPSPA